MRENMSDSGKNLNAIYNLEIVETADASWIMRQGNWPDKSLSGNAKREQRANGK